MSIDISEYRVGVIISLEDCGKCKGGGKSLRALKIRIGGADNDNFEESDLVTVVTSAPNVRLHSRVVVAMIGSSVLADDGEMMKVTKAVVGGVTSEGMLCDSTMLGWSGGAKGIAVNLPDSFACGDKPPSQKPRPGGSANLDSPPVDDQPSAPGLFEKKLTKEEKKKLAAERKAKRKSAKEAKSKD